jgi:hypothetical protein
VQSTAIMEDLVQNILGVKGIQVVEKVVYELDLGGWLVVNTEIYWLLV